MLGSDVSDPEVFGAPGGLCLTATRDRPFLRHGQPIADRSAAPSAHEVAEPPILHSRTRESVLRPPVSARASTHRCAELRKTETPTRKRCRLRFEPVPDQPEMLQTNMGNLKLFTDSQDLLHVGNLDLCVNCCLQILGSSKTDDDEFRIGPGSVPVRSAPPQPLDPHVVGSPAGAGPALADARALAGRDDTSSVVA